MRVVVLSLLLSACAHAQRPAPTIFDVSLSLDKHCNLVTTRFNETTAYPLNFESVQHCRLVTHAGTDILHAVFINGGYIVFAENNHGDASECFSEYTAFSVSKSGSINTTDRVKKSGSCYQDKELMSFEYFSGLLK